MLTILIYTVCVRYLEVSWRSGKYNSIWQWAPWVRLHIWVSILLRRPIRYLCSSILYGYLASLTGYVNCLLHYYPTCVPHDNNTCIMHVFCTCILQYYKKKFNTLFVMPIRVDLFLDTRTLWSNVYAWRKTNNHYRFIF